MTFSKPCLACTKKLLALLILNHFFCLTVNFFIVQQLKNFSLSIFIHLNKWLIFSFLRILPNHLLRYLMGHHFPSGTSLQKLYPKMFLWSHFHYNNKRLSCLLSQLQFFMYIILITFLLICKFSFSSATLLFLFYWC